MTRALSQWTGRTPDAAIPPRVRVRVFDRAHGCCEQCSRKLRPGDEWQLDHRVALINGGAHVESNLQVLCGWCHAGKTKNDVAEKAAISARRAKHVGIKRTKTPIRGWRRFDGSVVFNPKARNDQRRKR